MTLVYVRLTYQTLFLSLCKLLSSLFTLHLNLFLFLFFCFLLLFFCFLFLFFCFLFLFSEILAAFPLFVKKNKNKRDNPKLLLKVLEVIARSKSWASFETLEPLRTIKVLGVLQDARTPWGILAIFHLVCHAFLSIKFTFSGYLRSEEARNCLSGRRETGTQIGQMGKTENCIRYQIRKPVSIFRENRKSNAEKQKIRKQQWTPKLKNRQKLKNRSKI